MSVDVIRSPESIRDVENIARYYMDERTPAMALKFARAVTKTLDFLARFFEAGKEGLGPYRVYLAIAENNSVCPRSPLQGESPVVLSIPETTLEELRMRRSQRKPAPKGSDRPILNNVELFKRAGEIDPQDAALAFCEDMDRLRIEVEDEYDAFLLDPGMGPMMYITSDGRILRDSRTWDGEGIQFETSLDAVVYTLVVGAEKTGIVGLLDLLPRRPSDAVTCAICSGNRWWTIPSSEINPNTGKRGSIVCPTCNGRGWVVNETK